jgi:hypothetical protein
MRTSESINELATALAKAQAEITDAVKDASNPHFRNDYASLASVLEAVRAPLSKNGLGILQATKITSDGMILVSRLTHSSGQWVESETPLMMTKQDMQGLGSAITYARRYAVACMCGVSQVDDDGEGSAGRNAGAGQQNANTTVPPKTVTHVTPKVGTWDNGRGRV